MIVQLIKLIRQQWIFFTGYFLAFLMGLYFCFSYDRLDGHLVLNKFHTPFFDTFFFYITYLGDGLFSILILAILAIWNYRYALIGALGFGLAALITQVLKLTFFDHVERPYLALYDYFIHDPSSHLVKVDDYIKLNNSFPSGHSTGAFAIFTFLALYSKNKWMGLVCVFIAVLSAFSRVYLSQHFVEDIVVGSVIGTITALMVFAIYENRVQTKLKESL